MSEKFPRVWLTENAFNRLRELTTKDKKESCEWETAYASPESRSNIKFYSEFEYEHEIKLLKHSLQQILASQRAAWAEITRNEIAKTWEDAYRMLNELNYPTEVNAEHKINNTLNEFKAKAAELRGSK